MTALEALEAYPYVGGKFIYKAGGLEFDVEVLSQEVNSQGIRYLIRPVKGFGCKYVTREELFF